MLPTFTNASEQEVKAAIQEAKILQLIESEQGRLRFFSSAMQLLSNPALANCSRPSVLGCLLRSANLNLHLDPALGQSWAIPRRISKKEGDKWVEENQAIFQIGYKGWQELAYRAGSVESFTFGEVHANDEFDFQVGTGGFLRHKKFIGTDNGRRECFYVIATLPSGREIFEVVTNQEAEAMRMRSETQYDGKGRDKVFSAAPKGTWLHYAAMVWRKPVKDICTKRIRTSIDIMNAATFDNAVTEVFEGGKIIETPSSVIYDAEKEAIEGAKLHEDFELEFESVSSAEQLRELCQMRIRHNPEMKDQFVTLATNVARKKGFPVKAA